MKYGIKGANLQVYFSSKFLVAEVNTEALKKNPASLGKNTAEEKPRQNVFSYSYLGILFAAAKNAEIWGLLGLQKLI